MELTIEQTLQQGFIAYKEGKLQDAERLYHIILQSQPLNLGRQSQPWINSSLC